MTRLAGKLPYYAGGSGIGRATAQRFTRRRCTATVCAMTTAESVAATRARSGQPSAWALSVSC